MAIEDKELANLLRNEILKMPSKTKKLKRQDMTELEMISQTQKPYISPIMTMNQDEMLAFIEEFDVNELATLTDAELNRMQEVLGINPKNLIEGKD